MDTHVDMHEDGQPMEEAGLVRGTRPWAWWILVSAVVVIGGMVGLAFARIDPIEVHVFGFLQRDAWVGTSRCDHSGSVAVKRVNYLVVPDADGDQVPDLALIGYARSEGDWDGWAARLNSLGTEEFSWYAVISTRTGEVIDQQQYPGIGRLASRQRSNGLACLHELEEVPDHQCLSSPSCGNSAVWGKDAVTEVAAEAWPQVVHACGKEYSVRDGMSGLMIRDLESGKAVISDSSEWRGPPWFAAQALPQGLFIETSLAEEGLRITRFAPSTADREVHFGRQLIPIELSGGTGYFSFLSACLRPMEEDGLRFLAAARPSGAPPHQGSLVPLDFYDLVEVTIGSTADVRTLKEGAFAVGFIGGLVATESADGVVAVELAAHEQDRSLMQIKFWLPGMAQFVQHELPIGGVSHRIARILRAIPDQDGDEKEDFLLVTGDGKGDRHEMNWFILSGATGEFLPAPAPDAEPQ